MELPLNCRFNYTEQLTQRLYANDYFIGKGEVKTEEEAAELFKKGEIDLVVVFGPEFANRIMHSQDASIQLLSDGFPFPVPAQWQ